MTVQVMARPPSMPRAKKGRWPYCVHLLRDYGADMVAVDQDGTSPALIAAACGHVDVLRMLHRSGVDLQAAGHI